MKHKNELVTFHHMSFGDMQLLFDEQSRPLYPATETATLFGFKHPYSAIRNHCKSEGVLSQHVLDKRGVMQNKNYLTRHNMTRLAIHSPSSEGEAIERWLVEEVMESIYDTGSYTIGQQQALLGTVSLEGLIDIGSMSGILNEGGHTTVRTRFFKELKIDGIVMKTGYPRNQPTQRAKDMGILVSVPRTYTRQNGTVGVYYTTMVTHKGQEYFISKYLTAIETNSTTTD